MFFKNKKKGISENDLENGIIFRNYDLTSGKFTGCTLLLLDEAGITKTTIDEKGKEKIELLVKDESGKSVLKIFTEETYKLDKNPLTRQRNIRSTSKNKR